MNSKEICSIREWAPLTDVMDGIPSRAQRGLGLFPADLNVTCVDAIEEYLALGCDAGIVFWYNRCSGDMKKWKAETETRITCVKIVNSVEYMLAAGGANGRVSIFQIPKKLPDDLNLQAPCTKPKPIRRYTVRDCHSGEVTCCEWSKNGMKLYSGDRRGVVVLTTIDYQTNVIKSIDIVVESVEIVQLSVCQKYLLVTTLYRSIICQKDEESLGWLVTQVGKKDRKQLTDCGGMFLQGRNSRLPQIICGRPGLRFWIADINGNVEKTLLFKEALASSPLWEIPILNPKFATGKRTPSTVEQRETSEENPSAKNFGRIHLYPGRETLVVTHDGLNVYILNVDRLRMEAVARGFRRILDISVCDKEIFILEGERSLLRLAPAPEKPNKTARVIFNPLMPPPVPMLGSIISGAFESPVEYEPEEAAVVKAEECFELPPIEKINLNIPIELAIESPQAEQSRRLEIFNQIADMDFEPTILHHSGTSANGRKKRKSRDHTTKSEGIVEIGQAASKDDISSTEKTKRDETDGRTKSKTLTLTSKATPTDDSHRVDDIGQEDDNLRVAYNHVSDAISPGTLKKTIEKKTKSLAEELDLPELSLNYGHHEEATDEQLPKKKSAPLLGLSLKVELSSAYPQPIRPKLEDTGVQTTPQKKPLYLDEPDDYVSGEPVDGICQTLRATTLREDLIKGSDCSELAQASGFAGRPAVPKHFVLSRPINDEVVSFLPNFRNAGDPLRGNSPPPKSTESNASSEWEFLDN